MTRSADNLDADYAQAGFGNPVSPGQKPALILVDFARTYFDPVSSLYAGVEAARAIAAELHILARANGIPVVFTRVEYDPDDPSLSSNQFYRKVAALRNFDRGNPMADFTPELVPANGDIVVTKQYPSAFFGTDLNDRLRASGVDTLLITGLSTSGCVRATALDALCYGYLPVVVTDAVGDRDARVHEANLFDLAAKYATLMSSREVIDYVRRLR